MITTIFLWTTVLLFSFQFAGHLFDSITNIPNWRSGEPKDVRLYQDFYHKGKKTHFFAPMVFGSIIGSLVTLILVWDAGEPTRTLSIITFVIAIGILISVLTIFRPLNTYMETEKEYDPVRLKLLVAKWVRYDRIRLLIIAIGLATSIWALNSWKGG